MMPHWKIERSVEGLQARAAGRGVKLDVQVRTATAVAVPPTMDNDNGRRERVTQVSAEAKKVFDGEQYDESIVGSNDPETRRLVGAEMRG